MLDPLAASNYGHYENTVSIIEFCHQPVARTDILFIYEYIHVPPQFAVLVEDESAKAWEPRVQVP